MPDGRVIVADCDGTNLSLNPDDSADSCGESIGSSFEEEWVDKRSKKRRIIECVCLNLSNVAWSADNMLLPAVFHELSKEFHVDATALSVLVLIRGVSESLFAFPSGFFADVLPRPMLICIGTLIWSLGLVGCAMAPAWWAVCCSRLVNGIGLGIVQPLLFSLVADMHSPTTRGSAFGTMQFTGNMGSTFGGMLATSMAPLVIMTLAGWRFVLLLIAAFSALTGISVLLFVGEPRDNGQAKPSIFSVFVRNMPKVCQLFKVNTFVVVLAQGAPGMIPWFAFSFLTMWLELSCFTNQHAARITMFFGFGNAVSGLLGGRLLDMCAKKFPDHGPPTLAQMSAGIGIPMLAFIFFGLPSPNGAGHGTLVLYCASFFTFGMLVSACGIINNKVFADIVPQSVFSYVYAVDRAIEGTVGAAGSPAVGLLTDNVFHYNKTAAEAGSCSPSDARSLGLGVYTISSVAWTICFLCYSAMHWTYPKDRRRLQQEIIVGKGAPPLASCDAPDDSGSESDEFVYR